MFIELSASFKCSSKNWHASAVAQSWYSSRLSSKLPFSFTCIMLNLSFKVPLLSSFGKNCLAWSWTLMITYASREANCGTQFLSKARKTLVSSLLSWQRRHMVSIMLGYLCIESTSLACKQQVVSTWLTAISMDIISLHYGGGLVKFWLLETGIKLTTAFPNWGPFSWGGNLLPWHLVALADMPPSYRWNDVQLWQQWNLIHHWRHL